MQHYVPPAKHKKGETVKFEKFAAEIPQVEETLGFYWTQTFVPDGASFADGFFNDAGVVVATNWCGEIFDADRMEVKDGGIGYGIRRLVAERAHSAREGVEIATKLLAEFGYFHDGRTYTIADANEAWQLAIHQGNSWVARKIHDNEVVYIPNNFLMDKVDLNDKETWKIEPQQVERAIKDGRHDAKNPIFNWRKVVAQESVRHERWNANRNVLAWKFLTGVEYNDPEKFPYSAVIDRKLGVKDAMALLRLHEDYIGQDQELYHSKSEGICRTTSHDSIVYNLTADPTLTEAWKTLGRPCQSVFVPLSIRSQAPPRAPPSRIRPRRRRNTSQALPPCSTSVPTSRRTASSAPPTTPSTTCAATNSPNARSSSRLRKPSSCRTAPP